MKNPVEKIASNPVTSVAVMVFSALKKTVETKSEASNILVFLRRLEASNFASTKARLLKHDLLAHGIENGHKTITKITP